MKERLEVFLEIKEAVQKQIKELNKVIETISHKIWYNETGIELYQKVSGKGRY